MYIDFAREFMLNYCLSKPDCYFSYSSWLNRQSITRCSLWGDAKDLGRVDLKSYEDRNFPVIGADARRVLSVTEQLWKSGDIC